MPDWQAEAIILSVRPHGEGSAVISVLTADYGRHAGLVRGGASSKMRGIMQPGNRVRFRFVFVSCVCACVRACEAVRVRGGSVASTLEA